MTSPSSGAVWSWFGLSYSAYAVFPRIVLCSMPDEWQQRFVDLMNEAENLLPEEAKNQVYSVHLKNDKGRYTKDPLANYKYHPKIKLRSEK